MDATPMQRGGKYLVKHTTNTVKAVVERIDYKLDINTLDRDTSADAARAERHRRARASSSSGRCWSTRTRDIRATGGFIIIDEVTNHTVGAGMVLPVRTQA